MGREPEVLAGIYERVDEALGRLLAALPSKTDVILFSPNGMGPETSKADMLPAMLARVLEGSGTKRPAAPPASALWRLRAAVPTNLRALAADALPDRLALNLTARLESTGTDWKRTRAFAPPSDGAGFVRLNLKGREREGIVDPDEAESLLEQIITGLETFVDASCEGVVASVLRSAELDAPGPQSQVLPDLVVVWNRQADAMVRSVVSPRFGEVRRNGVGSGRSGNHTGATWAAVISGTSRKPASDLGLIAPIDLAATVCAVMGVPHNDLPGRSLLQ
jgi:predicted AlkP superfamily phosphohydrolase/phosphomutase